MGWEADLEKILGKLSARKDSEAFREPVEWEMLGLTDYPVLIKEPMDLGTVLAKLENKEYTNKDDAAADVRLIWSNSMLYNAPGSRIYLTAKTLSEFWEAQWATVAKDDQNRPPSNDEMSGWVELCHRIPAEDLGKVIVYLDSVCPSACSKRFETNEVDVNVDLIPGKVFREVQRMVSEAVPDMFARSRKQKRSGEGEAPLSVLANIPPPPGSSHENKRTRA